MTSMHKLSLSILIFIFSMFTSCGSPKGGSSLSNSTERFWPVSYPSDSQLNQSHTLIRYMKAAAARELPLRFFRDLIESNSSVSVIEGNWPSYRPGMFYGGTISMPSAANPSAWSRGEWSSLYNELFHAWYGLVFQKADRYAATRSQVHTQERRDHYRKAHPSDPGLAQEEAWSETVAAMMIELAPMKIEGQWKYATIDKMTYAIGRTVAPVSHSDRPGYTPAAEETYPAEWEYAILFRMLTMVNLP
jgi:hypothetical protein